MARFPEVGEAFGPYWIVGTLGRGDTGVVFEAQDTRLGRVVALKVLSPLLTDDADFRERFDRGTAQLRGLTSLHIVRTYDSGEQDGCLFLATQLVPGGDLGALLAAQGPLPPKVTVSVLGQLCEAVTEAYEAGVVHGDLKPSNVLVRDRGTVLYAYLCDFGVAGADESVQTRLGRIAGATSYLAPELHDGVVADARSDVYSLGCVLWTCLTGAAPYDGTDVQVALAHVRDPIPQLATSGDSSVQINEILRRAMAKDPGERYQTAAELGAALAGLTALPGPVRIAAPAVDVERVEPFETVAAQPPQEPTAAQPPAPFVETPAPEQLVEPEPEPAPESAPRRRLFAAGLPNAFTAPPTEPPFEPFETVAAQPPQEPTAAQPPQEPTAARSVQEPHAEAPEPEPVPRPLFVDEVPDASATQPASSEPPAPRRGRRAARRADRRSNEPKPTRRERRAVRKAAQREPQEDDPGGADPALLEAPAPLALPHVEPTRTEKISKKRDLGWLVPGALLGVVPVVALVAVFILANRSTPAQNTAAIVVDTGATFNVGAFDVKSGWTVDPAPDVSTEGEPVTRIVVGNLTVTNSSQDPQTASMLFSFIKGGKVITTVECRSGVVGAGLDQKASCTTSLTLKVYDGWDKITVAEDPDD